MKPHLIIFGDKTANEILETALFAYGSQFDEIEQIYYEETDFELSLIPRIALSHSNVFFHVGVANVSVKRKIEQRCGVEGWTPFTVIHPTAVIASSAKLGAGVFVGPLAVISSNTVIGDFCIIHIHASIGHDSAIGDYCAVLPGARISGNVTLGNRALIGSNAFVGAGLRIGDDCQVDALTYVVRDLPDNHLLSVRAKKPLLRIPDE